MALIDHPLTHKSALTWVLAVFVAAVLGLLTFGTSIVTRAEAAAANQVRGAETVANGAAAHVDRVEKQIDERLNRIESKVDQVLLKGGK